MTKRYGVIYKVTNKINGKSYIGQTLNLTQRKNSHKGMRGNSWLFHKAIKKYGFDSFIWNILENQVEESLMDEKEIYYIQKHNTFAGNGMGYNLTKGGNRVRGCSGEFHYLNRMSNDEKDKWLDENRRGSNNPNFGNGESISGGSHFLNQMSDDKKDKWLDENLRGDNNYQSKMSEQELKDKCWLNRISDDEKDKWLDENLRGDNNPLRRAYLKNPDMYKGENNANFGKFGKDSRCAKRYVITFPNGMEYMTVSIKDFCKSIKSYTLLSPGLYQCANNKIKSYKGFKCRHYNENVDSEIELWKGEK